eukprot:scaffold132416_cov33-Phaeocystis_antarctica.AAC.1
MACLVRVRVRVRVSGQGQGLGWGLARRLPAAELVVEGSVLERREAEEQGEPEDRVDLTQAAVEH